MVTLHDAIRALNPFVININGIDAYDQNFVAIQYDLEAAKAKLVELQAAETQTEQATKDAKASALAKLAALGLTADEIKALL